MQAEGAEASPVELRLAVDDDVVPSARPGPSVALQVALQGGGVAILALPVTGACRWAREVFVAVSAAYREATWHPHGYPDHELAPPHQRPGPGLVVQAEGEALAVLRFHLVVDICGEQLDAGHLRAELAEHISERFITTRVGLSDGVAISGLAS
jgi:hypothetical protein